MEKLTSRVAFQLGQPVRLRCWQEDKAGAVWSRAGKPLLGVLSPAAPMNPGDQYTFHVPQAPDTDSMRALNHILNKCIRKAVRN